MSLSLELGKGRQDMCHSLAGRGGCVHGAVEGYERPVLLRRSTHEAGEVDHAPTEPVQLRHDQGVGPPAPQLLKRPLNAWPTKVFGGVAGILDGLDDGPATPAGLSLDKPRTVLLLDEAAEALRSMPRRADEYQQVFRSKRGLSIRGKSSQYWSWNPVRAAFWAGLPEHRQQAIVDLDWHSLRHFCGWYFYVQLGFSDELTAYQLGHADAKLVRDLYGHGRANALERLKRGARVEIRPIRATSLPHAAAEGA